MSENVTGDTVKRSGFLTISGHPVNVVNIAPAPAYIQMSPNEKIKVEFDMELDTSTVKDAITLRAVKNNHSAKIDEPIALSYNFHSHNSIVEITPQTLRHNHRYHVRISSTIQEVWGELLASRVDSWFHTQINPNEDNIYAPPINDNLKIVLPVGTIESKDKFYIKVSTDLHNAPVLTSVEAIDRANSKLEIMNVLGYYEIRGFHANNNVAIRDVAGAMSVRLPICENSPLRKALASGRGKRAARLQLYALNEERKLWARVPTGDLSEDGSIYSAALGRFGTLALFEVPKLYVRDAFAYPVPFTPSNPKHKNITFTNLATTCDIKVFTVNGDLVWEHKVENDLSGEYIWDVKNKDKKTIASGVYIYLIESRDDHKLGKLMVVR